MAHIWNKGEQILVGFGPRLYKSGKKWAGGFKKGHKPTQEQINKQIKSIHDKKKLQEERWGLPINELIKISMKNHGKIVITCIQCSEKIEVLDNRTKYCSRSCKDKYNYNCEKANGRRI